jgi:hypothetical protein
MIEELMRNKEADSKYKRKACQKITSLKNEGKGELSRKEIFSAWSVWKMEEKDGTKEKGKS